MRVKISNKGFKEKPVNYYGILTNEFKNKSPVDIEPKKLIELISKGHSFILANFKDGAKGIADDDVKDMSYICLDIDWKYDEPKEGKIAINRKDFINLVYDFYGIKPIIDYLTFSARKEELNFRVIYKFESPVSIKEYKLIYEAFNDVFEVYLDTVTTDVCRRWNGTKFKANYNSEGETLVITNDLKNNIIAKLRAAKEKELQEQQQRKKNFKHKQIERIDFNNRILNELRIKSDYSIRCEIANIINTEINILDFIKDKFGGSFKYNGKHLQGACPIHGGKNPKALTIYEETNSCCCRTKCNKSMYVINLGYIAYKTNDFSSLVFALMQDYNIEIPEGSYYRVRNY